MGFHGMGKPRSGCGVLRSRQCGLEASGADDVGRADDRSPLCCGNVHSVRAAKPCIHTKKQSKNAKKSPHAAHQQPVVRQP